MEQTQTVVTTFGDKWRQLIALNDKLCQEQLQQQLLLNEAKINRKVMVQKYKAELAAFKEMAVDKINQINRFYDRFDQSFKLVEEIHHRKPQKSHVNAEDIEFEVLNILRLDSMDEKINKMQKKLSLQAQKKRDDIRKIKIKISLTEIELNELSSIQERKRSER